MKLLGKIATIIFICSSLLMALAPFAYLLYLGLRVPMHQKWWSLTEPPSYYMRVAEQGPIGYWHWEVYVHSGNVVNSSLLKGAGVIWCGPERDQECDGVLDGKELTTDYLFKRAADCDSFYSEDCRMEFDNRYGYPKRFGHLLIRTITIEYFMPCDQTIVDCTPSDSDNTSNN